MILSCLCSQKIHRCFTSHQFRCCLRPSVRPSVVVVLRCDNHNVLSSSHYFFFQPGRYRLTVGSAWQSDTRQHWKTKADGCQFVLLCAIAVYVTRYTNINSVVVVVIIIIIITKLVREVTRQTWITLFLAFLSKLTFILMHCTAFVCVGTVYVAMLLLLLLMAVAIYHLCEQLASRLLSKQERL